MKLVNRTEEMN